MLRKIRELIRDLLKGGSRITICGRPGDDAKRYQEHEVLRVLKEIKGEEEK